MTGVAGASAPLLTLMLATRAGEPHSVLDWNAVLPQRIQQFRRYRRIGIEIGDLARSEDHAKHNRTNLGRSARTSFSQTRLRRNGLGESALGRHVAIPRLELQTPRSVRARLRSDRSRFRRQS